MIQRGRIQEGSMWPRGKHQMAKWPEFKRRRTPRRDLTSAVPFFTGESSVTSWSHSFKNTAESLHER